MEVGQLHLDGPTGSFCSSGRIHPIDEQLGCVNFGCAACHPDENLFLVLMNDAISEMSGIIPAVAASRVALGSRISVPLYSGVEHVNTEQTRPWTSSSQESSARHLRIEVPPTSSGGTWRVVMIFGSLLLATPVLFVTAPAMITLSQILLGCGLATATWMIVKYPTDKAQVGQTINWLSCGCFRCSEPPRWCRSAFQATAFSPKCTSSWELSSPSSLSIWKNCCYGST